MGWRAEEMLKTAETAIRMMKPEVVLDDADDLAARKRLIAEKIEHVGTMAVTGQEVTAAAMQLFGVAIVHELALDIAEEEGRMVDLT